MTMPASARCPRGMFTVWLVGVGLLGAISQPGLALDSRNASLSRPAAQQQGSRREQEVKTVALVGNGRSMLGSKHGATIDGHDLVGRFNFFRTKGFEADVGQRTDLWFLNQLKIPGARGFLGNNARGDTGARFDTSVRPQKYLMPIVYAKPVECGPKRLDACGPYGGKDMKKRNRTKDMILENYRKHNIPLEIMEVDVQIALQAKYKLFSVYPSTGAMSIAYCLETYKDARISLYGFDFLRNQLGHYWEKFLKSRTVHSTGDEGRWIRGMTRGPSPRLIVH